MTKLDSEAMRVALVQLHATKRYRDKRDAEYDQACREAARDGYAPHFCKHGVNLWVSYDPICGACEAGENPLDAYYDAIAAARKWAARRDDLLDIYNAAVRLGVESIVADVVDELNELYREVSK